MNGTPGQPGIMQPFLIPISIPGSAGARSIVVPAGMSPATFGMRPPTSVIKLEPSPPMPIQQTPPVELYLCNTSRTATEPPPGDGEERQKKKASLEFLERSFQELNSRKIKDSLSSFLPSVPGGFDLVEPNSETKLRGLIDRPPIGGKEFLPLSGQALLGFRLLPGAQLPESYRMDPPSLEPKQHHRKRKRKHKAIDRTDDSTDPARQNPQGSKIPSDIYSFIKEDPLPSILHPLSSSHPQPSYSHPSISAMTATGSVGVPMSTKIGPGRPYPAAMTGATPSVVAAPSPLASGVQMEKITGYDKKKKKDKKSKDKKKEKKEKKKKKDKHHSQDPPPLIHTSHPIPPPLVSHPPTSAYTQHQHQHPPS